MPWLATAALIIVGLVVLALAVPVRFAITVHSEAQPRIRVRLRALLGLFDQELFAPRRSVSLKPGDRKAGRGRGRAMVLLRNRRFRARLRRLIGRLVHVVRVRELRGFVRIGLGDPADTGELSALLGPASVIVAGRHPDFELTSSFADRELTIDASCAVVIVPLWIVAVAIAFALHPSTLAALFAVRSS